MPLSQQSEPSKSRPRLIALLYRADVFFFLLVGLLLIYGITRTDRTAPSPETHPGVGKVLPHLELLPLTGDQPTVSQADLAGRVTLLNFWGTWCPPCREELPHLAKLRQRYAGREAFRLLAVSCPAAGQPDDRQSLRETTAALLKRLNVDLPTYYDPDAATRNALDRAIGFDGYPTTLLLDRKGTIRAVWVGYWPGVETEMERLIGALLEEEAH
jgi:cytochrome c biogenesis protein CcmG, thiol:disulfide interchange protein DsbE